MKELDPAFTPYLIFMAKNVEVCIMSLRLVMINRGLKVIAAFLAFFESLTWVGSLSIIVTNLDNLNNILFYCLAMATGTILGLVIESKLAMGVVMVRVITQKDGGPLLIKLRELGLRVSSIDAQSNFGKVQVIFSAIKRSSLKDFSKVVKNFNPKAFFTVEDIREVSQIVKGTSYSRLKNLFVPDEANVNSLEQLTESSLFSLKKKQSKQNQSQSASGRKKFENRKTPPQAKPKKRDTRKKSDR